MDAQYGSSVDHASQEIGGQQQDEEPQQMILEPHQLSRTSQAVQFAEELDRIDEAIGSNNNCTAGKWLFKCILNPSSGICFETFF